MSYYIVLDLEMCKVPGSQKEFKKLCASEIIQIGAVKLNDNYEVVGENFATYVHPEYGRMDAYIHDLTGINGGDLKDAPLLKDALASFLEWMGEDPIIYSWSDTDLRQLRKELKVKGMLTEREEKLFENWHDLQAEFGKLLQENRCISLEEALIAADIYQEGKAHDGLTDAVNTAKLFIKMKTRDEKEFHLNEMYANAKKEEVEHLSVTLGDLFANIHIG